MVFILYKFDLAKNRCWSSRSSADCKCLDFWTCRISKRFICSICKICWYTVSSTHQRKNFDFWIPLLRLDFEIRRINISTIRNLILSFVWVFRRPCRIWRVSLLRWSISKKKFYPSMFLVGIFFVIWHEEGEEGAKLHDYCHTSHSSN